jgi:hypothetical protein
VPTPWPPATTRTMAVDSSRIWLLPRSRLAPPTPLREAPPTPLKEQVPGTPHARSPGRRKAEVRGGEEGGSDRDLGSSRIEREWGDKSWGRGRGRGRDGEIMMLMWTELNALNRNLMFRIPDHYRIILTTGGDNFLSLPSDFKIMQWLARCLRTGSDTPIAQFKFCLAVMV